MQETLKETLLFIIVTNVSVSSLIFSFAENAEIIDGYGETLGQYLLSKVGYYMFIYGLVIRLCFIRVRMVKPGTMRVNLPGREFDCLAFNICSSQLVFNCYFV